MNELIRFDVQWAVRYVLGDRDVWVFSHPVYLQEHFT